MLFGVAWVAFAAGSKAAFVNSINFDLAKTYSFTKYQIVLLRLLNEKRYLEANNSLKITIESDFMNIQLLSDVKDEASLLRFITNPTFAASYGDHSSFSNTVDDYVELERKFKKLNTQNGLPD